MSDDNDNGEKIDEGNGEKIDEGDLGDLLDEFITEPPRSRLEIRRDAVCAISDVNLVLANRIKKTNVAIPSVPSVDGARLRVCYITDLLYDRLVTEITGSQPFRPDLEVFTVGVVVRLPILFTEREEEEMEATEVEVGCTTEGTIRKKYLLFHIVIV
jgi:hypothetical protein